MSHTLVTSGKKPGTHREFSLTRLIARLILPGVNLLIFLWLTLVGLVLYTNVYHTQMESAGEFFLHALTTLACIMGLFAIYWAYTRKQVRRILPERSLPYVVFLVTALTRIAWLYFYREIELSSDFEAYMRVASSLLHTGDIPPGQEWYLGYAPYVLGYGTFLAALMSVFGESLAVAQGANLALSGLSAVLLYEIGKKILGTPGAGLVAAMGWALLPAAAAMTSFPSTELPFITLMLAAIYAGLHVFDHRPGLGWLGLAAGAMILMNEFRPLGLVLVIAFCATTLIGLGRPLKRTLVRGLGTLGLALVYLLCSGLLSDLKEAVIGREIARNPFGFGLYLGLNFDAGGTWNLEDAELSSKAMAAGQNVQEFQNEMTLRSLERFTQLVTRGQLVRLVYRKLCTLWSNPYGFLQWISVVMEDDYHARLLLDPLTWISGDLYGALILLSLVEIGLGVFKGDFRYHLRFFLVKVLLVGLFLALVVFDNNNRYIAPALPLFSVLAAGGVAGTFRFVGVSLAPTR